MKKLFILGVMLWCLLANLFADKYDYSVTPASGGTVVVSTSDSVTFTLTPVLQDGWTFIGWDEDGDGTEDGNTDNPLTVTPSATTEAYAAIFEDTHCASYTPKIVNPTMGGSVAVGAGSCSCERVLTATADAANGYVFVGWNDGNTTNPRTVTIDTGKKQNIYLAYFQQPEFDVNIAAGEGGSIKKDFDESLCVYTVTAIPADGWEFVEWSDHTTDNPRDVLSAETFTAVFEDHRCLYYHAKTIPVAGGSISVAPGTCDCDRVLTATPDPGYLFVGWSDGNTNATRTVEIDPSQNQNIYSAYFQLPEFNAVPTAGEGGTVVTEYDESVCQLKVRAIPEDGWTFKRWSDDNTDNPRSLTAAATYTAEFEDHRCLLYYAKTLPVNGGRIQVANGTCDCERQLTAVPDAGYFFVGWNDGNTDNPRTVEINSDKRQNIYTARFERPGYNVTVDCPDGKVLSEWDDETCQLKLYALADLGWHFEGWDDDGNGTVDNTDNPRVLTTLNPQYKAIFTERRCLWYQSSVIEPAGGGGTVSVVQGVCDCDRLMTAIPDEGYVFTQWEDCSTTNPRNVTIENTAILTYDYSASFVQSDISIDAWTADSMILSTRSQDLTPTKATIFAGGTEIATNQIPRGEDAGIWSLPAELNAYAGQTLTVIFYDTNGNPVDALSSKVPYVATGTTKFSEIDPALPENTDIEVVSGTMTFDGDAPMVLGALTVYPNAKAVVPATKDVTYTHIYMRGDGINNGYPQLVANGIIRNLNSDTIYYDYTLDYHNYYPLAVPYDVKCEHVRTKSGRQASYEVQEYDGEERAWNGNGWTVFNDQEYGATLRSGTGYIVYAVPYKWKGTRQKSVVVRFPMVANLLAGEQGPKSTMVGAYNFDDVTFPSNKNWNLVGNPYLADYTPSGDNERMMVGYYTPGTSEADVHDYTYTDDAVRYLTYSEDGYMTYRQGRAQDITMRAFNSYFIQSATSGALVFPLSQRAQNAPRRKVQSAPSGLSKDTKEIAFGIVLHSADQSDRTGLLYGETFTPDYELNADLVKMHGSSPTLALYSLAGTDERAFNALSLDAMSQPVPLGYKHATAGLMTFTFDTAHYDASILEAVMLTDYATGRVVNLLDEHYSFTTTGTEDNARFVINAVLAPRVTTDIGGTGVDGYSTNELDGVYDLLGRRVSLDMLQQGVYIIIENGQSRKEVIQ